MLTLPPIFKYSTSGRPEIERACGVSRQSSDAERDDYVAAGASHFILGMSGTWNYNAVEDLVRWRDARNSK